MRAPIHQEIVMMTLHVVAAMIVLPLTAVFGEFVNYALIPYVLYLVWNEDARFYPALIILCSTGSTIAIFVLVLMFARVIMRLSYFRETGTQWLIFGLLAPLPFILWVTAERLFALGMGFNASVSQLQYYLSLVPFLYGMLLSGNLSKRVLMAFYVMFFLAKAYYPVMSEVFNTTLRIESFTRILYLTTGAIIVAQFLLRRKKADFGNVVVIVSMVYVGLFVTGQFPMKFTTMFGFAIGLSVLYLAYNPKQWGFFDVLYLKGGYTVALAFLFIFAVTNAQQLGVVGNADQFEYGNFADLPKFLQYKMFGDRGMLWASVLLHIEQTRHWLPPGIVETYSRFTAGGGVIDDTTFGAHNILLELVRQYGILTGVICSALYLRFIHLGFKFFTLKNQDIYFRVLAACALGISISAGFSGMYILMANYSLVNMGIMGMAYGTFLSGKGVAAEVETGKRIITTTITRIRKPDPDDADSQKPEAVAQV